MVIQCPHCVQAGKLPDGLDLGPHSLRCRRCSGRFVLLATPVELTTPHRLHELELEPAPPGLTPFPRFHGDSFLDVVGGAEPVSSELGPGDSHYELSSDLEDGMTGSDDDIPVVDPTVTSTAGESRTSSFWRGPPSSSRVDDPTSSDDSPEPWFYRVLISWGRPHFFASIGFGAFSLVVLAFLLLRTILVESPLPFSTSALIAGLFVTVALLFLCTTVTTLNFLLLDLTRESRRHRSLSDRSSSMKGC